MEENKPHMVQQVIKYSDGTETVINYRGVIVDGVLAEDAPVEEVVAVEPVEEIVEIPEVVEAESIEESA